MMMNDDVWSVLVQWGPVENQLAASTADDVYIVTEHVMSLHCCGAVSYLTGTVC